jgi:hypothetical protein
MDISTLKPFLQVPLHQYYIFVALSFIPVTVIFERAGFRPWWVFLLAVPYIGFILCLMTMVLRPWPVFAQKGK